MKSTKPSHFAGIPLLYWAGSFILILFSLFSLHTGWLNSFFWAAEHASVKGIDFYCGPKAFLNLKEGRSMYDTWGGIPWYSGGSTTWYLSHPAFAVWFTSWYSWFAPETSWWLWNITQMLILPFGGLMMGLTLPPGRSRGMVLLMSSFSFPAWWMLYVGNWHAPVVLSLALLFSGMLMCLQGKERGGKLLFALGLMASLFSKPVVVLMIPLFLIAEKFRRSTIYVLVIYAMVSALMLQIPLFNPQSIGIERTLWLISHPDFIRENLNIYKNNFQLNSYMLDNSIHWTNLIAQSSHYLNHIEIFSLSVFVNTISGKLLSPAIYKIPVWICLALSLLYPLLSVNGRPLYLMLLTAAFSLTFFLSYNTVWEYQYASVIPVSVLLWILAFRTNGLMRVLIICSWIALLPIYGPSLYFILSGPDYFSQDSLSTIRLLRVLPVGLAFVMLIGALILMQVRNKSVSEWVS
jgi:hypothetical protein